MVGMRSDDSRTDADIARQNAEVADELRRVKTSRTDGLSLTQRRILLAAAAGPAPAGRIFRTISQQERRPFLGDSAFLVCLRELSECEVPLLSEGDVVSPTSAGGDVLAGRADHARLSGVDRWIGGVHLQGRAPAWRYDERLETLVTG
jgi:hypothetical protein